MNVYVCLCAHSHVCCDCMCDCVCTYVCVTSVIPITGYMAETSQGKGLFGLRTLRDIMKGTHGGIGESTVVREGITD